MPSVRDLSPLLLCLALASCSSGTGSSVGDPTASVPAVPSPSASVAQSAQTTTLTTTACTGSRTQITWPSVSTRKQLLGTFTLSLKKGKRYSGAPTLQPVTTYIANVTATSTEQPSSGLQTSILRSLESKLDLGGLAPVGESTAGELLGGKYTIPATKSARTFVFFNAVREITAGWRLRSCLPAPGGGGRVWSSWSTGKAQTWAGSYQGAINCADGVPKQALERQVRKLGC